jgi:hypothetical protein
VHSGLPQRNVSCLPLTGPSRGGARASNMMKNRR